MISALSLVCVTIVCVLFCVCVVFLISVFVKFHIFFADYKQINCTDMPIIIIK